MAGRRIVVAGLPHARSCEELGKELARMLGMKLERIPVYISPTAGFPTSRCYIEFEE
jgi:hypothetical protein